MQLVLEHLFDHDRGCVGFPDATFRQDGEGLGHSLIGQLEVGSNVQAHASPSGWTLSSASAAWMSLAPSSRASSADSLRLPSSTRPSLATTGISRLGGGVPLPFGRPRGLGSRPSRAKVRATTRNWAISVQAIIRSVARVLSVRGWPS